MADEQRTLAELANRREQARYDTKLMGAKHDVIECARRLSNLCAEFGGDLSYCGEYLDALWSAIGRMETREKELCIR